MIGFENYIEGEYSYHRKPMLNRRSLTCYCVQVTTAPTATYSRSSVCMRCAQLQLVGVPRSLPCRQKKPPSHEQPMYPATSARMRTDK